jgi:hypothetical protein
MKVRQDGRGLPTTNANIFLAIGNHVHIITGNKTRQGYARKRILKLAGYFFPGGMS